jgi:hypothetical protein
MDPLPTVPFEATACATGCPSAARRFDEALRPLDLTNGQFSLLMSLNRPKPPERRGLLKVTADRQDRRSRLMRLTANGQRLLPRRANMGAHAPGARSRNRQINTESHGAITQTRGVIVMLYEVGGKWEGDTLVVDTPGLNDRISAIWMWRFTNPFTIHFTEHILPDTDVIEHICAEDETNAAHTAKAVR